MGCGSSVNKLSEATQPSAVAALPTGPTGPAVLPAPAPPAPATSRPGSSTSRRAATPPAADAPQTRTTPRPSTPPVAAPVRSSSLQGAGPPSSAPEPTAAGARVPGSGPPGPSQSGSEAGDPQADVRERAAAFTNILVRKSKRLREATEEGCASADSGNGTNNNNDNNGGSSSARLPPLAAAASRGGRSFSKGDSAHGNTGGGNGGGGMGAGLKGSVSGGLGGELEALLGGLDRFPDLLQELMAAPTQVLLPGDVNPEDAAQLQALSGCSPDEAVRLLDCLALLRAAAQALHEPEPPAPEPGAVPGPDPRSETDAEMQVSKPPSESGAHAGLAHGPGSQRVRQAADPSGTAAGGAPLVQGGDAGGPQGTGGGSCRAGEGASGSGGSNRSGGGGGSSGGGKQPAAGGDGSAASASGSGGNGGAGVLGMAPSPQQLSRHLGTLASLVTDYPGLRTPAMARDAPAALLRVLLRHPERAVAANAALALAALAAGPPAHKTTLIAAGAVTALLTALRGGTAAAAAGDAPGVAANAASAVANLVAGHAAGAAAVAAGGGIDVLLRLLDVGQAANVRTNAAGVLVHLTGVHESYRAALASAGGVGALAAGLLRGPDAAACNAATALFNLAALSPPNLRPAMAQPDGPLSVASQLLLCMSGRNRAGATDESVAASTAARTNASAVLLELCKDPAAAHLLAFPPPTAPPTPTPTPSSAPAADATAPAAATTGESCDARSPSRSASRCASRAQSQSQSQLQQQQSQSRSQPGRVHVPSALAALAAGRLPPPPDGAAAAAAAADFLSGGVELLYPVPPVVRGNALLSLMALARMGPQMQLELGRCGALGTLLELIAPGQDPAMQINAANAICSLAAANADIHGALVSARCVPLLAGLLREGGDAARANVCAVFVTMLVDAGARRQLQECGGLAMLVRLVAAVLEARREAGGRSAPDPGGVLCNSVGALAEAAKHADLRRGLLQVEFGESLGTLLRCLREAPDPAQVNAAAALCHLCREPACAVQLGRLRGLEMLRDILGAHSDSGAATAVKPGGPSVKLRHNAERALARLEEQLAAAEADARASADGREAEAAPPAAGGDAAAASSADALAAAQQLHVSARRVWDGGARPVRDSAASLGAPRPLRSEGGQSGQADDDEEEEDEVSTVITPPLPLGAY